MRGIASAIAAQSALIGGVRRMRTSLCFCATQQVLGDEKVAPFAKSGVAFLFELNCDVDVPFKVQLIVY